MHAYEVCPKSNRTGVTNNLFQVIPLESNALFHPSLPHFYALLKIFFWDAPRLHRYSPIDGLQAFKTGSLDDPHELGEKKKSHAEQDQVNREAVPVRPGTDGCSGQCEQVLCRGEAVRICPATTLVSSRTLSDAEAAGSLCRLAG